MDALLQIRTLLALVAMVTAAVAAGGPMARRLRFGDGDRTVLLVWSAAIGLVAWGLLLACLGAAGLLYEPLIIAITAMCAAAEGMRLLHRRSSVSIDTVDGTKGIAEFGRTSTWQLALTIVATAAAAASLASAMAPPIAGDALCYHLELPKRYLQFHGLVHLQYSDNSTYPLLAEMWFLWGLALDGPIAAQLMHWFCGVLLAGAAYVAALPLVGRGTAMSAACLVIITPGVNNQMTAPLNDVALAVFTTLAVAAADRGLARDDVRTFLAAGIMLGGALGVKFTALVFLAAAGIPLLLRALRSSDLRPLLIRRALLMSAVAALLAGPWYVRAYVHRGDPLYPFLSKTHANLPEQGRGAAGPSTFPHSKTPLGRTPSAWLEAPWHMTMRPERFGGRGHQLGPLWLMLLPLVVFLPNTTRTRLLPLAVVGVPYFAACVLLRQNVRFLLPLVPLGAIAAAAVIQAILTWPRLPRLAALAAPAVVILLLAAIPPARARHHFAVAVGLESRESYLSRHEPTFAVAAWANSHLPSGARMLSQEQRAFWFDVPLVRENIYRRSHSYVSSAERPAERLASVLRADGFTHLLLAEGDPLRTPSYDATLTDAYDAEVSRSGSSIVVAEFETAAVDFGPRRYRIVELR